MEKFSSFSWMNNIPSCVCVCTTSPLSIHDTWTLMLFPYMAIVDNAAMNMELQYLFESLLSILFFFSLKKIFFFCPCCGASRILGPWPEVGPQLPALAARNPTLEMAREAPLLSALSDAYLEEKFLDHLVISCLIFWETATLCKRSCTVYPFIACIWGWHTQPSFSAHSYTVFLCFTK